MAAKKPDGAGALQTRSLTMSRLVEAPLELVFKAWTDPAQLAQWWGPRGFTTSVCAVEARIGGAIHIVMRAPDGTEYPMIGSYSEFVADQRLVMVCQALDPGGTPALDCVTAITFTAEGRKTRLRVETSATGKIAAAAAMLDGMEAGWTQTLDRLMEHMVEA